MRILQINSVCGITSTGRIVADIYGEAQSQGHICMVAYGEVTYPNRVDGLKTFEIGDRLNCISHAVWTRMTDRHGLWSGRVTKKLIGEIEKFQPDVIHLHNLHGYYLNYQLLFQYLKARKIKVFWTLHDCWSFTGHCVHFEYVGCKRWMEGCYACPQKNKYPTSILFDNSQENYKLKKEAFCGVENMTLIVPSNWLKKRVERSFLGEYPIEVIYNGVDLKQFYPVESDFKTKYHLEEKYIVLGVANVWDERKGLRVFFELAKRLPEDIAIVLVGITTEQKREMPDHITGIEHTNSKRELAEIYSAADLFINPSVEETFGLTTLEAMACGTEAIVYKDTACEEIMEICGGTAVDRTLECMEKEILRKKENPIISSVRENILQFSNTIFCGKEMELYKK